jgi:hypothetical protein
MQICTCEVRLNDSAGHTVPKTEVTPAEILILQAIHGASAVVNIRPTKQDRRGNAEEWDRLHSAYGRAPDGLMDAGNGTLLAKLFPGAMPKLPVTLKDIGMQHLLNPLRSEPEPEILNEEELNGTEAD